MNQCVVTCKDKIIVLEDGKGKSKMQVNNPHKREITKNRVDDCLIKEGKRCDFLIIDHNKNEHYIEMKGKEVKYACEQIEETIKKLSKNIKTGVKFSYVVSTACPLTTSQIQIMKVKFKNKYNSALYVKNKFCECLID